MREVYGFEKIKKKTIELPRNLFKCVKLNFDAIIIWKKNIYGVLTLILGATRMRIAWQFLLNSTEFIESIEMWCFLFYARPRRKLKQRIKPRHYFQMIFCFWKKCVVNRQHCHLTLFFFWFSKQNVKFKNFVKKSYCRHTSVENRLKIHHFMWFIKNVMAICSLYKSQK